MRPLCSTSHRILTCELTKAYRGALRESPSGGAPPTSSAPARTDHTPFGWRRGHPILTPGWEGGRIMAGHFNRADTAVN